MLLLERRGRDAGKWKFIMTVGKRCSEKRKQETNNGEGKQMRKKER